MILGKFRLVRETLFTKRLGSEGVTVYYFEINWDIIDCGIVLMIISYCFLSVNLNLEQKISKEIIPVLYVHHRPYSFLPLLKIKTYS